MFGSTHAFVFLVVLALFPWSLLQMECNLSEDDLEGFCFWLFIASFMAGLPFMTIAFEAKI